MNTSTRSEYRALGCVLLLQAVKSNATDARQIVRAVCVKPALRLVLPGKP